MWGHTAAQIELMMYDAPTIKYKRDDSGKPKPGEKGFKRTSEQAQAAYEKWKKRKEKEKAEGVKMDLGAFLGTGERKPLE